MTQTKQPPANPGRFRPPRAPHATPVPCAWRDRGADGEQFGFAAAGGKLRGHADGVIVAGPDVGIRLPSLWEHKALGQKSWNDLVKHGLRQSKPICFAQVQLYMAYLELEVALLLPSAETAAMLFWALLASGQITLRKVYGWQTIGQPTDDRVVDLAA